MTHPLYVVIPVRDRHKMVDELVRQLIPQGPDRIFIFDNESDPPQPDWGAPAVTIPAPAETVFSLWNRGLDMAEMAARLDGHSRWNVAVLNSDLRIVPNFLHTLARGLRSRPGVAIAYPNIYRIPYKEIAEIDNPNYAGQTFAGYAWMMAGETGLRCDERFLHWYGDSDLEKEARHQGYEVICVGGCKAPEHLDSGGHVWRESERLAIVHDDEARFAEKWGMDPRDLFLASNPGWGESA